ncbi:trimethylamine corrinoid protein [Anaerolineales bacterium]|nr:trimethylamine corrinoid protein [Anaerolineales bacterium]
MSEELIKAITEMREEDALKITTQLLESGTNPLDVLEACRKALDAVGKRFEEGIYFLPELMLAGEMMNQITEIIKPKLAAMPDRKRHGKVLLGTVAGDIHDIGKNIVSFMLDVNGFEVLDLGVDVPPQKFVDAIQEFKPQVVALSGFLTLSFDAMKDTVAAIQSAGLRDKVKIMIGGGQINEEVKEYAVADGYGRDAMAAVSFAKEWVGVK